MVSAVTYTETPFYDELVGLSTIDHSLMVFGILGADFLNIHFLLQMQPSMQIGKEAKHGAAGISQIQL
jgi:hypothetical protein